MKNKLFASFAVLIALTLTLTACGGGKVAASSLARVAAPQVPAAALDSLVSGNTAFAFDLYHAMLPSGGNQVYSPYSISLAFAMAYAGARGNTALQMADSLHYFLPGEQFHPAFNLLDLDLAARPDQVAYVDERYRFQLSIANSLWGQDGWSFLPEYLDLLAENYGAGLRLVDFENAPESARRQINKWVSDQTQKRIQDILPPGSPDSSTRLAIVNAIYFKATWQFEFDPNDTSTAPFYLLDGETASVDMMGLEHSEIIAYASGEGWQAVSLPYKGELTDMVLIVPDLGTFESFDASLTSELYTRITSLLTYQQVQVYLPKFTFEATYGLTDSLKQMGMADAFDPARADFSGIDGSRLLYIGDAIHKAFIAVDEKGTEAAAATIVLMAMSAMPQESLILTIDRPFFFAIRDVPTGTILFMGRVLDPR